MSRTKKDILETENMLQRLTVLLSTYGDDSPVCYVDAQALRRISMTLHRWHELECGSDRGAIERDEKNDKPYWINNYAHGLSNLRHPIPDREAGARKRLAKILKSYPALTAYVQGDPRGCALYILKPGDIPEGATVDSCYSRGLAVYR